MKPLTNPKKPPKKPQKETFLKYLDNSRGIISLACKRAGITRQTYYNWVNADQEFKEQVNDIQETQKDYVESKLIENIEKNDTTAIIFYLKTKAKDRGYTDKTEIELNPKNLFLDLMKEVSVKD